MHRAPQHWSCALRVDLRSTCAGKNERYGGHSVRDAAIVVSEGMLRSRLRNHQRGLGEPRKSALARLRLLGEAVDHQGKDLAPDGSSGALEPIDTQPCQARDQIEIAWPGRHA